jgi:hypothetical protein
MPDEALTEEVAKAEKRAEDIMDTNRISSGRQSWSSTVMRSLMDKTGSAE